jgi:hypothetical protein
VLDTFEAQKKLVAVVCNFVAGLQTADNNSKALAKMRQNYTLAVPYHLASFAETSASLTASSRSCLAG